VAISRGYHCCAVAFTRYAEPLAAAGKALQLQLLNTWSE
jgi:hypothetical protein